ncbi:multiple sugar transport system substrate-binding protein [Roseivivax halotolerans]|uniref:Multiple sugar transport system substrate-binding protein n=1 Tax=Roseivivax halotolerans TaxID=93684 RepID=A0A1I6AF75_9RHOB|nr:extracellular solute-binding protein [Roseivivax halotolerans]SFQ67320.1 multiple sugar transport system substrate-binding protein [Roseivivax halotolerans]
MKHLLTGTLLACACASAATAQDITLGRFFGACEDAGNDTKASVGEACIIQSIINAADAEIEGVSIETLPTDWGNYYDQIKAAYAGGTPPDVHVMHRHRVPEFAGFGALAALTEDDLSGAGIDPADWTDSARDAVTYNGEIYGVPMDLHANLWHVNMDLMAEAGLVENGEPVLPSSPEELLEHARQLKEATGQNYLAADFAQFPIGVRLVLALMWQQGENIFSEDGTATIDNDAAQVAVETITQLFAEDLSNPQLNYADSQQSFLNGEAAVLVNGTWVVDFYTAEAAKEETGLDNYYAADFPTLFGEGATWADSHIWVIPSPVKQDAEKYSAALKVLAFINEHNVDWARTGHMAVRNSVLESDEYAALPHRTEYAGTADIARDTPPAENYGAIQDVLNRELQAIWLTDKPVDDALADANIEVQDLLDR